MQNRVWRFGIVLVVTVATVAFLSVFIGMARPAQGADTTPHGSEASDVDAEIRAARRISIPFGIASPLALEDDGSRVVVTGHGTCLVDGAFDVHVFVVQPSTDAIAMGRTEGDCPGGDPDEDWIWEADAATLAPVMQNLEAGDARACASAEVRSQDEMGAVTTITKWWCKDIVLE